MQSDVFSVIADPTRRNIVHLLAEQTRTVGAVVEHLNMSQPTISKHLKVLREARAVTVLVEGQRRLYSLNPEVFDEITAWVADIQAIAHSTKEQRESQIKQASVIEVVDVVESSGDDTAKTEKTEKPSAETKAEKTTGSGESDTDEQKQQDQDTEQRPKATGKTTDETAGEAATAHAQDVQDQDKTSDSDAPAQPVESSSVVEQPEPTPQERVSKTLSQRKRFEAFPGSTGSANAGVKPGASLSGERDAEKASGQKDRDGQGASHEAGAHDSHAEGESSAKKKTTTAAIAKPAIFDDEARSAESSVTSGLGPKTSTKSAARIVSKPAQQAAPAASEEGTETAGTVEENEFIPMRPFTPSGSSYQEKPQQSYGYDDGIDDGQQGFSPEARGFVPRSKSQDKTAQAKPEAVKSEKTDKSVSAQKDVEPSVKSTESVKAPARSHDTKQPHAEAQTQERTHISDAQQLAQQSEGAKPVKPSSAESKQTSRVAKAEAQKPVKDDVHKSSQAKPQKPESPSPQAQTAAKTESPQAQSVREEASAPKPGSERAARVHTGKPGAATEVQAASQETPAQAAKPAESPMQAAASEKKPEDKPAETTATNTQTAAQPGTSSTVSYGIDTAEKSTENGERAVQGTAQKQQAEKVQGNAGSPDTKKPAKPATIRSAEGTASSGAAAKTQEPEKKPAAQVEESSSTAQEPQKSGAETPAEAAPAAAQNMTQAQTEEAKAVEAKLAENAPVKSDSVTFTAVLPVVTPEMSSVQGARPQEDEEAADASDKTKSATSEKSGKNEELPYQTQTEYTSAFGTADTPKEPPRGLLSRVFGRRR